MAEALEDGMAADPARYPPADPGRGSRGWPTWWTTCSSCPGSSPGPCSCPWTRSISATLISDAVASTEALARVQGVRLTAGASGPLAMHADPRELARALAQPDDQTRFTTTPAGGGVHVSATANGDGNPGWR